MQLSTAVNSYPAHYCYELELRDGTVLDVRPICPEGEHLLARFHFTLSDESVYRRYFGFLNIESRIRHERLTRLCCIDYRHEMAFIALTQGEVVPVTRERSPGAIVGVARLIESEPGIAEVATVISDAFQYRGIGASLMRHLVDFAKERKLSLLTVTILPENRAMQRLLEHQGFRFKLDAENEVMKGQLALSEPRS